MAAIGYTFPTLLDQAKRMDPNGSIANIVELLAQRNPVIEDAVAYEGNLPTGHRFTSRTGLPSTSWRRFNEGVAASKSRTSQHTESIGMLVSRSEVDCELAKLNGNEAAFRMSEDKAHLAALANEAEASIFYASTEGSTPNEIQGLSPRFDALTGLDQSGQIVNFETGDDATNTSMWFVVWGDEGAHLIYPKGSTAGIQTIDMGQQLVTDSGGTNKFRAYVTEYVWNFGVCVRNWRNVSRICNIPASLAGTGDTLIPAMIDAYYKLDNPNAGKLCIYANRTMRAALHKQARAATSGSTLGLSMIEGKEIVTFMGSPIRVADALLNTEADIT